MEGRFTIYPVGKTVKESKSGKREYWFASGKKTAENNGLMDKCNCFNFWTDKEYTFDFMKPVDAILDINGDFISVVEILNDD